MEWEAELIETLPDGTKKYRMVGASKIDEEEFLRLYGQGLSDYRIAIALGMPRTTVGDYRRRRGLPAHFTFGKPSLTKEEKRRIRELHAEGLPIKRIAGEISRGYPCVLNFCHKKDLDTRMTRGKAHGSGLCGG